MSKKYSSPESAESMDAMIKELTAIAYAIKSCDVAIRAVGIEGNETSEILLRDAREKLIEAAEASCDLGRLGWRD